MSENKKSSSLPVLLREIRACNACVDLPLGPRPILAAHVDARVLVIGQAPGKRVHESGVAWKDPSGERLREWMGVNEDSFYDETKVALIPMGFCYPGTGRSGDLPPRKECSALWHDQLLGKLRHVKLTLLIGKYAQKYALADELRSNLTETVKSWRDFTPARLPLPHPSPRNNRWLKQNPWFLENVVPYLQRRVKRVLAN